MWSDSLPLPPDFESPAFWSFSFRRSLPLRLEPLLRLPVGDRQAQGGGRSELAEAAWGSPVPPPPPPLPYLHCADCWRCPHHSCTPALGSLGAGCRGVGAVGTGKGKPWAKVRPLGAAKGPACPGQRRHWNHRDHGGTSWPCLWREGEGQMSWVYPMPPHP